MNKFEKQFEDEQKTLYQNQDEILHLQREIEDKWHEVLNFIINSHNLTESNSILIKFSLNDIFKIEFNKLHIPESQIVYEQWVQDNLFIANEALQNLQNQVMILTQTIFEITREISQIEHENTTSSLEIQELRKSVVLHESELERKTQELNNKNDFIREFFDQNVQELDNTQKDISFNKDQINIIHTKMNELQSKICSLKNELKFQKEESTIMERVLAEFIEKTLQDLSEHNSVIGMKINDFGKELIRIQEVVKEFVVEN